MRLLVTRPEPDGARTADALRVHGHDALLCPLLRVETEGDAALGPGPWDGVAVTSANAVRAMAAHPRCPELLRLPALANGRRTAQSARAAGFADVISADGNVEALVRLIRARLGAGARLLYLAGEDRAGDLAAALEPADIAVDTVAIYRAVAVGAFPGEIVAALAGGAIGGVLHYSRRTALAYANCAEAAGVLAASVAHYCLSAQVAEPLAGAGIADLRVAATPDERALFALL